MKRGKSKIKHMLRNAQAALEFLMTYGWAILVVIVVIGALAYFGVLNPSILLPEKCTIETGFDCKDFIFNTYTGNVILNIQNGRGKEVILKEFTLTGNGLSCDIDTDMFPLSQDQGGGEIGMLLSNGGEATVAIPCDAMVARGGKQKSKFTMTWKERGVGEFDHTSEGEILAKMESHAWPTESMCELATSENLCDELQVIFPPAGQFRGYAQECCFNDYGCPLDPCTNW